MREWSRCHGLEWYECRFTHGIKDDRGRNCGHAAIVRPTDAQHKRYVGVPGFPESSFMVKFQSTRNGKQYGGAKEFKPLKAKTLEEAFVEVELMFPEITRQTVKLIEKRIRARN